jgi:hypothetical protein
MADAPTKTVTVQLTTNETEQATDLDLLIPAGDAGAPFSLVVQSELYGPLFTDQLGGAVGQLDERQLDAVKNALMSDGESLDDFATGAPFAGPDDPRRAFKEQELTDLQALVAECRSWMSGTPAQTQTLDPELLLPPPPGTSPDDAADQFIELLDVLAEMEQSAVPLPSEIVALLAETALLDDIVRWRTEFGLDAARVLSCFTIADSAATLTEPTRQARRRRSGRKSDLVLDPFLEAQAEAGKVAIDIRTSRRCWHDDTELRVVTAATGRSCRARARLAKAA